MDTMLPHNNTVLLIMFLEKTRVLSFKGELCNQRIRWGRDPYAALWFIHHFIVYAKINALHELYGLAQAVDQAACPVQVH